MEALKEKIHNNEPLTKSDIIRAFQKIKLDVEQVKDDVEKNPEALEHLNMILGKIERTIYEESFQSSKRAKTLLDISLNVNKENIELGHQHKDILQLKNIIQEIKNDEETLPQAIAKVIENMGILLGATKGEKKAMKITRKQSKVLEFVDLDSSLNPQEQKIMRYLALSKYDVGKDQFISSYTNEIQRNARIKRSIITEKLSSLVAKGLLKREKYKNKVMYSLSHHLSANVEVEV